MRKTQIWAVSSEKMEAFFRQQPDVTEAETMFHFGACRITITALPPRGEGFWTTPQTQICMEGPEQELEQIYHRFFLQFLSAGG